MITLSMDFNYTPVITVLMWLANLTLLIWDWDKLRVLFSEKSHEKIYQTPERISKKWRSGGWVFYVVIIIFLCYGRFFFK